jgi:hypothetical protein
MSFWDELTQGIANAADDIRHKVVEEPWYGREVTGNIELKEQEPAEQGGKWDALAQEQGTIQPEPPAPAAEMER